MLFVVVFLENNVDFSKLTKDCQCVTDYFELYLKEKKLKIIKIIYTFIF